MAKSVTEISVWGLDKHWPSFPSSAFNLNSLVGAYPETVPAGYIVTLAIKLFWGDGQKPGAGSEGLKCTPS